MFRSLNVRLLISYVAVILVCLLVAALALLAAIRIRQIQQRFVLQRLSDAARLTIVAARGRDVNVRQLAPLLQRIDQNQNIRVLLLDPQGSVVFDSRDRWKGQDPLSGAQARRSPDGSVQGLFTDPERRNWLFVALPWPGSPSFKIVLAALQPRGATLAWALENLMVPLVWAGIAALVVSTLLAFLIGRSVAAPLRRVAQAAEAIASGEPDTRAPISGPAEVQALARSFNAMADQVEAAQRSQRDFVANVSHEMKTPLTSIQGFSQAILDGTVGEPAAVERAASVIHKEAQRMRRMVDDLLVLARFDAGQVVMAQQPLELGPLLRECVEKLSPQAQEVDVALELDAPEGLLVIGDADRLTQVFTNLLDNGLAHTSADSEVAVAARPMEEHAAEAMPLRFPSQIEVTITDTGEGIPAEALPRIFERFYRVDKARRRGRGAGLGLAIAKEIVEAHGGTITAESVVGLGTRLIVRLPAAEDHTATT